MEDIGRDSINAEKYRKYGQRLRIQKLSPAKDSAVAYSARADSGRYLTNANKSIHTVKYWKWEQKLPTVTDIGLTLTNKYAKLINVSGDNGAYSVR